MKVFPNRSTPMMPIFAAFLTGIILGIPFGYKIKSIMLETENIPTEDETYKKPKFHESDVRESMKNSNEEVNLENYLKKILVDDWNMSFSEVPSDEKLNVPISEPFIKDLRCESNSELDVYIKKPKFSRDRHDYDVSRNNYQPQNLVCSEGSEMNPSFSKIPAVEDCSDVPNFSDVLTILNTDSEINWVFELAGLNVTSDYTEISTPYTFIGSDHFDFDPIDANFERMIREAELQNADIVTGAFKNENGLWDQSCLHLDIRNYTLEVWTGYYKSIRAMAYCDATFGPILMRNSVLDKIEALGLNLLNLTIADRLVLFTANPDLRVIHCPDCMFYTKSRPTLTKETLLQAARRLQVTEIRIEQAEFTYTCNEIGFTCDSTSLRKMVYFKSGEAKSDDTVGGSLPPPPCQAAQGALAIMFLYLTEKHNISACLDGGDMLQSIKFPGGHIPWNCDADVVVIQEDSLDTTFTRNTVRNYMTEYNLKYGSWYGDGETFNRDYTYSSTGDKLLVYNMKNTGLKLDTYYTKLHLTDPTLMSHYCLGGFETSGKSSKVLLQGFEISTVHNPGKAARFQYGQDYLKHVSQRDTNIEDWAKEKSGFTERCARSPLHSCLRDVAIDGNIQFRRDQHRFGYI